MGVIGTNLANELGHHLVLTWSNDLDDFGVYTPILGNLKICELPFQCELLMNGFLHSVLSVFFLVALQTITCLAIENGPAIVTDDFPINCHLFCHQLG